MTSKTKPYLKRLYTNKVLKGFLRPLPKKGRATNAAFLLGFVILLVGATAASIHAIKPKTIALQQASRPQGPVVKTAAPLITATGIITLLNQQRVAKGLSALNESTQLDKAAVARANDMIAKAYQDNTTDNPVSFVSQAGYNEGKWALQSTYYQTSNESTINTLLNATNPPFITTTGVTDIGVGVVLGTIKGINTNMIVVFLATPQQSITQQQPSPQQQQLEQAANCGDYNLTGIQEFNSNFQTAVNEENSYDSSHSPATDPNWEVDNNNYKQQLNATLQNEYNSDVNFIESQGCTPTFSFTPLS